MGVAGSGKSTVGANLARIHSRLIKCRMNDRFRRVRDLDQMRTAGKQSKKKNECKTEGAWHKLRHRSEPNTKQGTFCDSAIRLIQIA
jgi:gluconate kinase